MIQATLFEAARDAAGECGYGEPGTCTLPVTHVAHGLWVRGPAGAEERGEAIARCCRHHADYYASAWCPIYPAQRDVAWVEILP